MRLRPRDPIPAADVEVEIVEGLPEDDPPGGGAARERALPDTGDVVDATTRRRWGRRAGAGLAVVALVAAANVVEARRHAAVRAEVADVPGVVEPLDGPLTERWRVAGYPTGETDRHLLVADGDGIRAVDPATGQVAWERPAATPGEACRPVPRPVLDRSLALSWTGGDVLVCGRQDFGPVVGPQDAVTIVDASTGGTLHTVSVPGGLLDVQPIEDDVVVAVSTPEGHLAAVRFDVAAGTETWTFLSEVPLPGLLSMQLQSIERFGDAFVLEAGYAVGLDLATGAVLDPEAARSSGEPAWYERLALDGGDVAVWQGGEASSAGRSGGSGHVEDADGQVLFALPGPVTTLGLHDGSVPEVLVTVAAEGTDLRGLDRRTGRWLWTSDGGSQPLLQLRGVLVVHTDDDGLRAIDVRDGRELWSRDLEAAGWWPTPVSDGEVLLVPATGGTTTELVALDLDDGAELWRMPTPDGTQVVVPTRSGHVVAMTQETLVGLG